MKSISNVLKELKANIDSTSRATHLNTLFLSEMLELQLLAQAKRCTPNSLVQHRRKVYSQFGQDGIIQEIHRRIGINQKRFIEIGTAVLENNTNLLLLQGWSGLWIDFGLPPVDQLPSSCQKLLEQGKLSLIRQKVTRENIAELIESKGFSKDIDLLCIDIDQNTFYAFEQTLAINPRVCVVEYNGFLPPEVDWVVPYSATAVWDGSVKSGASLAAFVRVAKQHGYCLVACELSGTDAFFVREDLVADKFAEPNNVEFHWEPLRMHLDRRMMHSLEYLIAEST